ncbi:hypothetical protein GH741_16290 [Aquibacillus halophilus]|uniref:Uncharacterized protein n=1 Tax=Aquibacillus halophilus TaxID=930132 RepID=A0A6A8DEX9_9BACI|nr:hypothetical protein [Aquibacillus halophilus]MRH44203.1 hypothetical protein [Aquibacillus halophilus]
MNQFAEVVTILKKVIVSGTVSAAVLGLFLFMIEELTNQKVYTLLLNVDFIPIFENISLPIIVEWIFHIIISWGIALVFHLWLIKKPDSTKSSQWVVVFVLTALASLSYIPLTLLAIKETPSLDNVEAIFFWIVGHILYATVLKTSTKLGD